MPENEEPLKPHGQTMAIVAAIRALYRTHPDRTAFIEAFASEFAKLELLQVGAGNIAPEPFDEALAMYRLILDVGADRQAEK